MGRGIGIIEITDEHFLESLAPKFDGLAGIGIVGILGRVIVSAAANQAGRMAERWYARYSQLLGYKLRGRQPLILYASHPEFEQTNAIAGELGE